VLVGRDAELTQLQSWVKDVAAGRGVAVLLEGEAGVGKSALLEVGLADAPRLGCRVLWGKGEELTQRFILRPLLDCLHGSVDDPRLQEIGRVLRGQAGSVPAIGGADPVLAACEQFLTLMDELCAAGPMVLVVEDLQWADELTVQVWHRLARSVSQLPLLLAGTVWPQYVRSDLSALRRSMRQGGGALMELGPLPDPAVIQLVTRLAGAPPGPNLTRLAAGAAGNSLYLIELLAALQRDGALSVNGLAETPPDMVPASLGAVIAGRLAFLSVPTREVLRTACLLGTSFTVGDLATVVRRPAMELARTLREATEAGVLIDTGTTLMFRHALIRGALYDDMPASLRAALHRDAAEVLAASSAPVEQVAAQLLRAGDTVDAWTLDWLATAAPALTSQAPGVAAELLRVALDRVSATDPRRGPLSARLATALFRAGRSEEAERAARTALGRSTDPDLVAQLYWYFCEFGRFDDALTEIEKALAAPGSLPQHSARLRAMAAQCYANKGDISAAARAADGAVDAARAAGDHWAAGYALNVAATALTWRGQLAAALPLRDEGLALARENPELSDLWLLLQTNQSDTYADLDRYDSARHGLHEVIRLAEQTGNLRALTMARPILARVEYESGRWDDALFEAEAPAEFKDPSSASYVHGIVALIALHRDDSPTALRHIEEGAAMAGGWHDSVLHARAIERERAGEPKQALAELVSYLAGDRTAADWLSHLTGVDAVRLAVGVGDDATARDLAAGIEEFGARTDTPSAWSAVLLARGLTSGDAGLVSEAADVYRGVGRLLPAAQAMEAAADLYVEAGDRTAARRLFAEAIALYTQLGAAWDIARADARFRALGIRRGRRVAGKRPQFGPGSLTAAEVTVARLVAEGLSNPQIGDRLFLSRRTVQTHVSHILAKLDMRSRVDIARQFAMTGAGPTPAAALRSGETLDAP
jgi:DNA-binding CsgD family transcriptional regulator